MLAVNGGERDAQVARVFSHPALVVTRPIEWGTVILGYEQAQKYKVYDQDGTPMAQIAEDRGGLRKQLCRQLLGDSRSFTSTVFSADGSTVIFRLRRPTVVVNSHMYVEDGQGSVLGEVHQRWHPIKRKYDLLLGNRQFARVTGSFMAWDFEVKGQDDRVLARIDRKFQGFRKELFTDAGKYAVHFEWPQRAGPQLSLMERMIMLACAIAIDYDYFSSNDGVFD